MLDSLCATGVAWCYYPNRLVGDHHRAANHAASRRTDFARNHVSNAVESSDLPLLIRTYLLADAWIVAKLLGTSNEGTHIAFVDKSGFLEVSPACSSWANISLVLLTWMVISQYQRRRWQVVDLGWCALVVLTVVAINTIRMAMMGISEEHYFLIHGTVGSTIISWMIVGVTVALCLWGTRSDWTEIQKTVRLSTKITGIKK